MVVDLFVVVKNLLYLEIFCKKGIEVLLLSDCVDEWMMSYLIEFNEKLF